MLYPYMTKARAFSMLWIDMAEYLSSINGAGSFQEVKLRITPACHHVGPSKCRPWVIDEKHCTCSHSLNATVSFQ